MCSIYGSKNRSMFDVLHDATVDRGKFVFSYLFVTDNKQNAANQLQSHPSMDTIKSPKNTIFCLGHNQAPTSNQRAFNKNTCHPFRASNWLVAHNGVLTNHLKLLKKFKLKPNTEVDSNAIPILIDYFNQTCNEVDAIIKTLSLLEGTFAVWIYNEDTNNVYIARQGSTLFGNIKTGSFCSIQSKTDWIELSEGILYQITDKIAEVGKFTNNSPFFTL